MKTKLTRKCHPEIYLLSLGLLSSCGYVRIFDGKNDELIAWSPEKGFEEDPTGGVGTSGGGGGDFNDMVKMNYEIWKT